MQTLKHFRVDIVLIVAVLVVAFLYDGPSAVALTAILIAVEIVFSFDNAAVNAKYLVRLNDFWQKMFLTAGVLVAVVGMRLVFPFVIVCLSGGISPWRAVHLALERGDAEQPGSYGYILNQAHPSIAAFGGTFLLLLFLDFVFDTDRQELWIKPIERPLRRIGRLNVVSVIVTGGLLLIADRTFIGAAHRSEVLFAGLLGIVIYLIVNSFSTVMEHREEELDDQMSDEEPVGLSGRAALSIFVFLEVLDATFSFDGVIGAFAITPDPILIMMGLGVGALCVRSMTVYLVREGTLAQYRYLEAGAHWAIGALALLLFVSIEVHLGEITIGLVGIGFIVAAWLSSIRANHRDAAVAAYDI